MRELFLDIETAPNEGLYFDRWREGCILDVTRHWFILSFACKWRGEKSLLGETIKKPGEDKDLLKSVRYLLDKADVVIAHNGDRFDIKKLNARFLINGIAPPSCYRTIDTLKVARRIFAFESNKLDDLGNELKVGRKLPTTGKNLWKAATRGDRRALRQMLQYNGHDVLLLERVYEKLRPWLEAQEEYTRIRRRDATRRWRANKEAAAWSIESVAAANQRSRPKSRSAPTRSRSRSRKLSRTAMRASTSTAAR